MKASCTGLSFRRASRLSTVTTSAPSTNSAKDALSIERHLRQPHPDRVVDGIRDGRRRAEGGDLADALGAKWAVGLFVIQIDILHHLRYIVEPGNLVIGERRIGHLAAVEMHLLEHREADVHQGRA